MVLYPHLVTLALDFGSSNLRAVAPRSTSTTSIVCFLELFYFFPLQTQLVAAAHVIPITTRHKYEFLLFRNKKLFFYEYLAIHAQNYLFRSHKFQEEDPIFTTSLHMLQNRTSWNHGTDWQGHICHRTHISASFLSCLDLRKREMLIC